MQNAESCSNCIGLTYFSVECNLVWLYQSNQSRASSLPWRRVSKCWPCNRSTFSDPNRVSLQALSQQLPLRLIEGVIPQSFSSLLNSWLAYWLPRSLWKISPALRSGQRRNQAIRSASITISLVICSSSDQPTIRRLNRSMTTARNNHPSSVEM